MSGGGVQGLWSESEVVRDLWSEGVRIVAATSLSGGRVRLLDEYGRAFVCAEDWSDDDDQDWEVQ